MTPLGERLAAQIAATGPITVAEFMATALADPEHGYYRTARAVGADGDFITAPEISQLFGEMIGAWMVDLWLRSGRPTPFRLIELGPGRGTLMADIVRTARVSPEFLAAASIHLVEINPALRALQAEKLGDFAPIWHESLADVPESWSLLVGNEFLDALPIRQLVRRHGGWRERLVDVDPDGGLRFVIGPHVSSLSLLLPSLAADEGAITEFSPAVVDLMSQLGARLRSAGGAALLIDYGYVGPAFGETLQAVRSHRHVDVLESPSQADLTAHVDFGLVGRVAREAGLSVSGPIEQGRFLTQLGIGHRAAALVRARPADSSSIESAYTRLVGPDQMGGLFKVLCARHGTADPAGFV